MTDTNQPTNKNSEMFCRQFLEHSLDGMAMTNHKGLVIEWNAAMSAITGISREEAMGVEIWDLQWRMLPPAVQQSASREKFTAMVQQNVEHPENQIEELTIYTPNGLAKTVSVAKFVVPATEGKNIGVIVRDISEKKAIQTELEKNLEQYQLLANYSSDGVSLVNSQKQFTYISPAYLAMLGYEQDEILGRPIPEMMERIHPDDHKKILEIIETARKERIRESVYSFRALKKDGSYIWLEDHVRRDFDEQGNFVRSVINSRDITQLKQTELQIRTEREFSQDIIDALAPHICVLDENGVILYVNQAWKNFADANGATDPNYFIGTNYLGSYNPNTPEDQEGADEINAGIRRVLRNEIEHFQMDYPCNTPEQEMWFSVSATRFKHANPTRVVIAHLDVTDRKLNERKIQTSETRYRSLFTHAKDIILIADDNGHYIDANPRACELFGYSHQELTNLNVWDITPGMQKETGIKLWQDFIAAGEQDGEYPIVSKDGKSLLFDYHAVANVLPGMHMSIMRDITKQKKVELALAQNERRLSDIINSAQDAILSIDERQLITLVNPAAEKMFGYKADQLLGKPLTTLIPARYRLAHTRHIASYEELTREHPAMYGLIHAAGLRANGEEFSIETSIAQSNVSREKIYTVIVRDITERLQMERKLEESEVRFRNLVENTHDIIAHFDAHGRITYLNPAGVKALECKSAEDMIGKKYYDFVPVESAAEIKEAILQQVANRSSNAYLEYPVKTFTGQEIWLGQNTRILYENGQFSGIQIDARDITQLKKAQEALLLAHDQAVKASQLKSQLIAKVSHELRTPLNSILGFAELLKYNIFGELRNDDQQQAVDQIIVSSQYLTEMVNEFLDESEIESKSLILHHAPFVVAELLRHVESSMSILAERKGISLTTQLSSELPENLWGDERRIKQIIINLTSNAIKFTQAGEVSVRISTHAPAHWMVQVQDSGVGIPKEAQDMIFEPFKQVDNAITRNNQGTGLGLTITKQLVEIMNGRIFVESEPGKGSLFTVILPIRGASKEG